MIVAMILAGGTGSRVGADRPKQFIEINGKPILAYTVEIYQNHPEVDAIEVVCHREWTDYLDGMIKKYKLTKVRWIAEGGNTFQESVIHGNQCLNGKLQDEDIVMIHYGAAPFTSSRIISEAIKVCKEKGSSVSCIPCYQLMGTNDSNRTSRNWVDRDKYIQVACPQSFRYGYLLSIYERARVRGILETCEPHTTSLMYALGDTLYQSYGEQRNIKITTMDDLELFCKYL